METIEQLRQQLDAVDTELVATVGRRLALCQRIAHFKQAHGLPMMQPQRVAFVKQRCGELGVNHGLEREFVQRLYGLIIDEACRLEELIIGGEPRENTGGGEP